MEVKESDIVVELTGLIVSGPLVVTIGVPLSLLFFFAGRLILLLLFFSTFSSTLFFTTFCFFVIHTTGADVALEEGITGVAEESFDGRIVAT